MLVPQAHLLPQAFRGRAAARAHFREDFYGRPRFAKFLPYFTAPGTVLDFGCHEGVFLHLLREHGREGLGIDYDRDMVRRCRDFGLEAQHADIFTFTADPAHSGRYGGVLMADFVEHFDPHPLQRLLRQTVEVLAPGGTMIIVTPNTRSVMMIHGGFYESTIEHHNPYSIHGLRQFLAAHGMQHVASGVDPDSRLALFAWHPGRLLRNLAMAGLGRILCGRGAWHEHTYLVMRKQGDADALRYASASGTDQG